MIILTGGRASGKTSAIIRWLVEAPGHRGIVCVDEQRKRHIINMLRDAYPHMDVSWKNHVLTADFVFASGGQNMRGRFMPELAIDDCETVLMRLLGSRIEMATMNATWIPLGAPQPDLIKAEVYQRPYIGRPMPEELLG